MSFKAYTQLDAMDCGPTCVRMVAVIMGEPILFNISEKGVLSPVRVYLCSV